MNVVKTLIDADSLRDAGQLRDAAELYESLLDSPQAARGHLGLGEVFLRAGQFEEAEHHLRRAFTEVDLEPAVLFALGQLEEGRGNRAGAVARYRQCAAIAPAHGGAGRRLSELGAGASEQPQAVRPQAQAAPQQQPAAAAAQPPGQRAYRKSVIGTVAATSTRRENYLGMVNALTVITVGVQPFDGGPNVSITIAGTKVTGAAPEKGHVVELDLSQAKQRGNNTFETRTLFNHTAGGEITSRKSMLGR